MSANNIPTVVADIMRRIMIEKEQLNRSQGNATSSKQPLTAVEMKRVLDEVNNRVANDKFNQLNWQLAECQGMLEKLEVDSKKLHKHIKLIRRVIHDITKRINIIYQEDLASKRDAFIAEHYQDENYSENLHHEDLASGGAPLTTDQDQDAKDSENLNQKNLASGGAPLTTDQDQDAKDSENLHQKDLASGGVPLTTDQDSDKP